METWQAVFGTVVGTVGGVGTINAILNNSMSKALDIKLKDFVTKDRLDAVLKEKEKDLTPKNIYDQHTVNCSRSFTEIKDAIKELTNKMTVYLGEHK